MIRWNTEAKPSLGGISFFISFLFAIILYSIVFGDSDIFRNVKLLGFFGAACLAFIMGLADDAYNTRPLLKFLAQVCCGLFIVFTGTSITFFDNAILNGIVTVIWVVGVMNSINMLDNMDGISASVATFILLACALGSFFIFGISHSVWNVLIFFTYWSSNRLFGV